MHTIAESNVLLRAHALLPSGVKVATEEFREGWNVMRSGGAGRLEKKVRTRGWNLVKFSSIALRSGVGGTPQESIARALSLALHRIDGRSNAVEVERIELTQYPWFFLAKVQVHPYRIQEGGNLLAQDEAAETDTRSSQSLTDSDQETHAGAPILKQLLTSAST